MLLRHVGQPHHVVAIAHRRGAAVGRRRSGKEARDGEGLGREAMQPLPSNSHQRNGAADAHIRH
eukprot:4035365-Pleurochrysis_carterae.AAC.1